MLWLLSFWQSGRGYVARSVRLLLLTGELHLKSKIAIQDRLVQLHEKVKAFLPGEVFWLREGRVVINSIYLLVLLVSVIAILRLNR